MDKINEQMYQANIDLVDKNKVLEEDKKILTKRINRAIEEINYYDTQAKHYNDEIYLDEKLANNLLNILQGRYVDNE